jgi:glycosyltransferase involved in cell wall biosynthesis
MLALSPVPEEGAGCRFRIAQYVPALERAGVDVTISPFFTREFFRLVYQRGHGAAKTAMSLARTLDRLRTVANSRQFDVVFIYREAMPVGPAIIETLLARAHRLGIVYDFDDAVFLENTSDANRVIAWLKWPSKVQSIIRHSTIVTAGNEFLAAYARQYNDDVRIIPTCVDTSKFVPRGGGAASSVPVVGWIGTPTTVPYLLSLAPILQEVARRHRFVVRVCGAGPDVSLPGVDVRYEPWSLEREVELFNTCDIGVYPLADDEWARGKCGFKAIQFMACGVPVVAAPVGVNCEIIRDGVNGLLASTPAEWVEKLDRLLADAALRARLGAAGRGRIEVDLSLDVNAPKLVAAVLEASDRARRRTAVRDSTPVASRSRTSL